MIEWQRARGFILPAMTDTTEAEVATRLLQGTAQLWLGERSAIVSEIIHQPRHIHLWLAGGDLKEILSMTPGIAAYARTMGCDHATVAGRKGWRRALTAWGFTGDDVLRKAL